MKVFGQAKRWLASAALCMAVAGYAQGQEGQVNSGAKPSDAIATMYAVREAAQAGNIARWEELVSPACQFVEPTGRITDRNWHRPMAPKREDAGAAQIKPAVKISELETYAADTDTAVVSYREDIKAKAGDQEIVSATRYTEVYWKPGGRWQLMFSAETPIVEKTAVAIDRGIYADYVGEYQMSPELIGRVYLDGERLMLIGTGWKRAYELLPLGGDTFFVKEMPNNEITFVRDKQGKVVAQGPSRAGKGPTGPKIR